ncbi:hypothetical protein BG015_000241 [Linnemannia schmuckeri]|uniref:Uncharacterized protein n=1 Tax=Linnemannia schmuckeri TaxID=64567 RepID=A0A9P5V7R0_9FUNG|nr:hypothetical protein BG015_000241 [Linnemannia schmuckeri]
MREVISITTQHDSHNTLLQLFVLSNQKRPHHIKLQAQANECKPSTILWIARIVEPDVYESRISFTVRDTWSITFDWHRDTKDMQILTSPGMPEGPEGFGLTLSHYNLTLYNPRIWFVWLGETYFRAKPDWRGYMPGAPIRPQTAQYWFCLPDKRNVRFSDEFPNNPTP